MLYPKIRKLWERGFKCPLNAVGLLAPAPAFSLVHGWGEREQGSCWDRMWCASLPLDPTSPAAFLPLLPECLILLYLQDPSQMNVVSASRSKSNFWAMGIGYSGTVQGYCPRPTGLSSCQDPGSLQGQESKSQCHHLALCYMLALTRSEAQGTVSSLPGHAPNDCTLWENIRDSQMLPICSYSAAFLPSMSVK